MPLLHHHVLFQVRCQSSEELDSPRTLPLDLHAQPDSRNWSTSDAGFDGLS